MIHRIALALGPALLASSALAAQGPSVLLLHAESTASPGAPLLQPALMATGQFGSIDSFDCSLTTGAVPTLADLAGFDVVLCFSDDEFLDPSATGDVLADAADAGQSIVVGPAAGSIEGNFGLAGRWSAEGFGLLENSMFQLSANEMLGAVLDPEHPIVQDVATIDGGPFSPRPDGGTLDADAVVLATYADGSPLAIAGPAGRVHLGVWPGDFTGTDGVGLGSDALDVIAQGLLYAALGGVGTSYCGPAVANSSLEAGVMYVRGSGIAGDPLALSATNLPEGEFGFFLAARQQGFTPMAGASQGTLCLGSDFARYSAFAGQVLGGNFGIEIDTSMVPFSSAGVQAILPGETLNFTCWYRDVNPASTSNFTDAVSVTFN